MAENVKFTLELHPFYANNIVGLLEFIVKNPHYRIGELDRELFKAVLDGLSRQ